MSRKLKYLKALEQKQMLKEGIKTGVISPGTVFHQAVYEHHLRVRCPGHTAVEFNLSLQMVYRIIREFK